MASRGWCLEGTSCNQLQSSRALRCQARLDPACRIPTAPPSLTLTKHLFRPTLTVQCIDGELSKRRRKQRTASQKVELTPHWHQWLQSQYRGAVPCQEGGQWRVTGASRRRQCCSRIAAVNGIAPGVEEELESGSAPSPSVGTLETPFSEGASVPAVRAHLQRHEPSETIKSDTDTLLGNVSLPSLEQEQNCESKQGTSEEVAGGRGVTSCPEPEGQVWESKQGPSVESAGGTNSRESTEAEARFEVRAAASEAELLAAAWMRADVYADGLPYTRFVDSYRKQFAEQVREQVSWADGSRAQPISKFS